MAGFFHHRNATVAFCIQFWDDRALFTSFGVGAGHFWLRVDLVSVFTFAVGVTRILGYQYSAFGNSVFRKDDFTF